MVEFVSCNGYVKDEDNEETSYIGFTIKGGDSKYCIGDSIWCNETELEVQDRVSKRDFEKFLENCTPKHKLAFKGAMRRMGYPMD